MQQQQDRLERRFLDRTGRDGALDRDHDFTNYPTYKTFFDTDFPAYSDTPLTVTVLACPNWPFIYKKDVVTVTPLLQ